MRQGVVQRVRLGSGLRTKPRAKVTHRMSMTDRKLIELAAFAAIAGGALRIVSAFAGELEAEMPRELFYLIIDILFLFGTLGIYLVQRQRLGWPGLLGFVFAASGFALIAGPDGTILGLDAYALGSNVIGAGLFVLSLAMFKTKSLSAWAPGLWIASIGLGAITFHVPGAEWFFLPTGVLFGAGFVVAGVAILKSNATRS